MPTPPSDKVRFSSTEHPVFVQCVERERIELLQFKRLTPLAFVFVEIFDDLKFFAGKK